MTTENESQAATSSTPEASVETVRKVYAADLREKDRVNTVFRVTKKEKVNARSGKVFLSLSLADKSGTVDARVFDKVDALEPVFQNGDYVLVQGSVIVFHGRTQVVVEAVERLDPEPLDPKEFEPPPAPPAEAKSNESKSGEAKSAGEAKSGEAKSGEAKSGEAKSGDGKPERHEGGGGPRAVGQIRELITERVNDPFVKQLLLAFLDDSQVSTALPVAPAAKGVHHAWRGGLAEHVLSVMRLTLRVSDHYPMADRDLLLAGAFLHDVMKGGDGASDKGFDTSDEGRLVGHAVLAAQKIREKTLGIPGFPPLLEQHLTHLAISQQGTSGAPGAKVPVTLEAQIVDTLSSLDARISSWVEAMQRDPNERWTEHLRAYDRSLWKGFVPTGRGRAPVEGGRRKHREEKRKARGDKSAPAQAGEGTPAPASQEARPERPPRPPREPRAERPPREDRPPREERPARPPREDRPPRDPKSLPGELTFKPFSALAPSAPAKSGGEGGGSSEG
ncbi:HD domain-containing protein [Corallococcus exercitus]|uniref:HD domain-containing protein n=1 Tax=Corallococcus exercitus TaxID=2316736 RepID=A0A7Y4KPS1_9BACT|nr:OB-fold nucleic acid binding domain-containing protein [Corallococcus exercitus]NOK36899.1 HD domain-containing protein [Corallococcus exercitus]